MQMWNFLFIFQDNCHLGQTLEIIFFISLWLRQIFILSMSLLATRLELIISLPTPPPWTTAILVGPKYRGSSAY